MIEFKIPDVGENISSGTVVKIFVKPGDSVKKDQDLFELETDKASLPVPSTVEGVVKEILIKEGQDVKIGQAAIRFDAKSAAATSSPAKETKKETPKEEKKDPVKEAPKETVKASAAPAPQARTNARSNESIAPQVDVPAAPSVRRLARELGIEVGQVPGSGPGGRISMDDVKAHTKSIVTSGGGSAPVAAKPLPDFSKFGGVERESMNKIRQVTADHMSMCWTTIPHVTQFDKADITELEKLRKKISTKDRKVTITPFLLKVMASALKTFPKFNCSIDMAKKEIIYKKYYNLGIAVDTERGLLVPVIKDVDKKSIKQLTDELTQMAERARDKKTGLDELQGGCMTLTNLGGIGGYAFTPIVNWPEVCILGVSRGSFEPVYENGQFIPRFRLPLSLSYDHRIIDGADAARFLRWICEAIEQPFLMELES